MNRIRDDVVVRFYVLALAIVAWAGLLIVLIRPFAELVLGRPI